MDHDHQGLQNERNESPKLHTSDAGDVCTLTRVRPWSSGPSSTREAHLVAPRILTAFQQGEKLGFRGVVCSSMRLRMTDSRERRMDALPEATGENTKSKALDRAAEFYLRVRGRTRPCRTARSRSWWRPPNARGASRPRRLPRYSTPTPFRC